MALIYIVITFIVSIIIEFFNNPIIHVNFFLISIPLLYFLIRNKRIYVLIIIILSLVYDLLYSSYFLLYFAIFLLILLITLYYYKRHNLSFLNITLIEIIAILLYYLILFFFFKITYNNNYIAKDILKFYNTFISLIYVFIWYLIIKKHNKHLVEKNRTNKSLFKSL